MERFEIDVATRIVFGRGAVGEVRGLARSFGTRAVLVTTPDVKDRFDELFVSLERKETGDGLECVTFAGVVPNPTVKVIEEGAAMAREFKADVVVGIGGGSSMDVAKAIALGATNAGPVWDYRIGGSRRVEAEVLPVVVVTTTAGTGSHVTPVAVLTNSITESKSAIVDGRLRPRAAIVDPSLSVGLPAGTTAATGFDVFAHAFESTLHPSRSRFVDLLAEEAMRLVVRWLPEALADGKNYDARSAMCWADTLAGLCISHAGTTLPHGIAMAIGGHAPHVAHGQALAAVYAAVADITWEFAVPQFARLDALLRGGKDDGAAPEACAQRAVGELRDFISAIGLGGGLRSLKVRREQFGDIQQDTFELPDYKMHPRLIDGAEVASVLEASY
ncbi:MAG: iron-containing alcohol dehydrogenase [Acidimicrobiales bacterium]